MVVSARLWYIAPQAPPPPPDVEGSLAKARSLPGQMRLLVWKIALSKSRDRASLAKQVLGPALGFVVIWLLPGAAREPRLGARRGPAVSFPSRRETYS